MVFFKKNSLHEIARFLESFRVRVTVVFVLGMLIMGIVSNSLITQFALQKQFEQLRRKLTLLASAVALSLDAETVQAIPLNHQGIQTHEFKTIYEKLRQVKEQNPEIGFIYVMTRTERPDILQFVVDPDPYLKSKEKITAYPGDRYDTVHFPKMPQAFKVAFAEEKIGTDEWGSMLSGYAPILNAKGDAVAILGIDMMAADVFKIQKSLHERALFVLLLGILLSVGLGVWFSIKMTRSVRELAEGIRRVSRGEFHYQVKVSGRDEISELSRSFNQMAADLRDTRKKNQKYFYDVMQSLVRIVEARDPYTQGHSERVSQYASQIAARMGFPPEAVEMLRQTAVLHDIGKLGVHEDILTKSAKLTVEEWDVLRSHPVIGEDILRPVLLRPEMLSVVRGHHERFDGKGYPDHLSGDEIHIFAQILSVADAYDAMTSTRPYRVALGKEEAIEELKTNRSTQFNSKIADIFIDILKDEIKSSSHYHGTTPLPPHKTPGSVEGDFL